RDLYLSDDEKRAGNALMACVSRSHGETLELAL
ncbi:oxidoreductase, partial [Mycobacterium sp. ITM-2017-0098]